MNVLFRSIISILCLMICSCFAMLSYIVVGELKASILLKQPKISFFNIKEISEANNPENSIVSSHDVLLGNRSKLNALIITKPPNYLDQPIREQRPILFSKFETMTGSITTQQLIKMPVPSLLVINDFVPLQRNSKSKILNTTSDFVRVAVELPKIGAVYVPSLQTQSFSVEIDTNTEFLEISVGVYNSGSSISQRNIDAIIEKDLPVLVSQIMLNNKPMDHLRVGLFSKKLEAEQALQEVRSLGFTDAYIKTTKKL